MRDDLLARFVGVTADGAGWSARCPAHDDQRASLSIATGEDGRWLLHCHAGCAIDTIVTAAGLVTADLFSAKTTTKSAIVATYTYHDEGGAHLFDVVRFAPKDFRQRRGDGTWKMSGVRRVLYRLPELQGQTTVYITEGEKDADHLRTLGLTATTNPGGAGKWKPEYVQQLRAAAVERVVILPDNDEPGRQHAEGVARSCHAAGLQAKIVYLPDLPPKGDISDWLSVHGRGKDDIHTLTKATAIYTPAPEVKTSLTLPSAERVRRQPVITFLDTVQPEQVDWIWPGRLARRKYTLLAGEPGLGKTYLYLDASARISNHGTFPDGTRAPHGRVLILTAEDGLSDTIRPRLDALGADTTRIAVLEAVREPDGTRSSISLTKDLDMLMAAVREVQPDFVWVDPFSAYLGRTDTHRDSEVRAALAPLLDMAEQERFALGAICHLSKDAQKAALHRPGGSIAFVAAARIVLALAADPHDPTRRLLAPIKSNICRPAPTLAYRITDDRLVWETGAVEMTAEDIFRQSAPGDREAQTDAEQLIADLLADETIWPIEAKDALAAGQAHGVHERTIQRAAKRMGIRIERLGFGRGGRWLWHRPIPDIPDTPSLEHPDVSSMAPMQNPSLKEEEVLKSVHRRHGVSVLGTTTKEADDAGTF